MNDTVTDEELKFTNAKYPNSKVGLMARELLEFRTQDNAEFERKWKSEILDLRAKLKTCVEALKEMANEEQFDFAFLKEKAIYYNWKCREALEKIGVLRKIGVDG